MTALFQPSLRDCFVVSNPTQDYVLGYTQPSLRDYVLVGVGVRVTGMVVLVDLGGRGATVGNFTFGTLELDS
jgi:hypothetical protein